MKQATILAICITTTLMSPARSAEAAHTEGNVADSSFVTNSELKQMLDQIVTAAGLPTSFELKEANVLNIEAKVVRRKGYIYYNPAFITRLNAISKNKWPIMSLLAHEVGHHLKGHTARRGGSRPEKELQADEFAGFVLFRLGATLQQSQQVMHYIARTGTSKTHPSRHARLLAIERGWKRAAGIGVLTGSKTVQ